MDESPAVVAHVMLRSASGDRPGIDVPISAGTVDRLRPAPEAVAAVVEHLGHAGFTVLHEPGLHGLTIEVTGPKELFEQHFGVDLALGSDGSYSVREQLSGRAAGPGRRPADPTSVPLDDLPTTIRHVVAAIALEAAVSFDEGYSGS